jgi:crossover junction endodeoxyribonuclease RuvC
MITIGIDPGLSGAVAVFYPPDIPIRGRGILVHDTPTFTLIRNKRKKREIDVYALADLLRRINEPDSHAYVEQVGAMPGQGVSSVFSFGKSFGIVLGVLAALSIPVTLVTPQAWKKALGVPAAKDGARARASQLMPRATDLWARVKDDGRAEAALLAYFGAHNRPIER